MAIGRISGPMLVSNLERLGVDLSIETDLIYFDVVNSKIGIQTATPDRVLTVVGNAKIDNVTIAVDTISNTEANGNVTLLSTGTGNVNLNSLRLDLNNIITAASGNIELANPTIIQNIYVSTDTLTSTDANGNITLSSTGTGVVNLNSLSLDSTNTLTAAANANIILSTSAEGSVQFAGTYGTVLPAGNLAQRPTSPVAGLIRVNTESLRLEFYDGLIWQTLYDEVTIITSDSYVGDGNTTVYTLSSNTLTNSVIASLDGNVQIPGDHYNVSGNSLTFVTAPVSNVEVELRSITTVDTVGALEEGNVKVVADGSIGVRLYTNPGEIWRFDLNGDFVPVADDTYNIGNAASSVNTVFIGNTAIFDVTLTTSATTPDQVLGSFDGNLYTSAEFTIEAIDSTNEYYQKTKILAVHNGNVTAEHTEYGNITITGSCATFDVDYNTGNLRLLVTPLTANSTVFKSHCVMTTV